MARWEFRERAGRSLEKTTGEEERREERGTTDPGNLFRLAREFRRAGFDPRGEWVVAGAFAYACGRLGLSVAVESELLREAWEGTSAGPDALDYAFRDADRVASEFVRPGRKQRHARLVALCHVLSRTHSADRANGWFALGSARVAAWLGCHRETVDADVKYLEAEGVIRVRRDAAGKTVSSYKAGMAREVQFLGDVAMSREEKRDKKYGAEIYHADAGTACEFFDAERDEWVPGVMSRQMRLGRRPDVEGGPDFWVFDQLRGHDRRPVRFPAGHVKQIKRFQKGHFGQRQGQRPGKVKNVGKKGAGSC